MKHSLHALLAAMVALGVTGCNKAIPTEPSATDPLKSVLKATASDNIIVLPTSVTSSAGRFEVVGTVKYAVTQSPILSEDLFDVVLRTDVSIIGAGSFRVNSTSQDRVNLTGRTSIQLEKYYFLRGGPLSMYLYLEFDVSATRVTLTDMSIIE